ncbi:MAG: isoaspartyl peptidase/L-asparaginase [Flavobacteriales bacterium]|nr:isoaspartyl peptidase/L-asparaginase [Flavobacteriales bacterium]
MWVLRKVGWFGVVVLVCLLHACSSEGDRARDEDGVEAKSVPYAIAIHGGAGYRSKGDEKGDALYMQRLNAILDYGYYLLENGKSALDVVEMCLRQMEDDSLFNAGVGAVLNASGEVELDASIMDGAHLKAGAVSGVRTTRHPISAARFVMDSSVHVFLSGSGADRFSAEHGLEQVAPEFFVLRSKKQRWLERNKQQAYAADPNRKFGTVGCVVLDKRGHLAAGTSTGGMDGKQWGRIGDSPVIGAGTYADDRTCAVSCTGHGEYFIRNAVAYQVAARMQFGGVSVVEAADTVVMGVLKRAGGVGGLIAMDKEGNIHCPFNTSMMFRAWRKSGEEAVIRIYE